MINSANQATLDAYRDHVEAYVAGTGAEIAGAARHFIEAACRDLAPAARCLEIGAAFGRDAEFFRSLGFELECVDAVEGFVAMLRAKNFDARLFNLLTDEFGAAYDLIFANAVLLHFTRAECAFALAKIARALKPGGRFAFSLKAGEGEAWSNAKLGAPRFFCFWRPQALSEYLRAAGFANWDMVEARDEGTQGEWLYVMARAPV